MDGLAWLYVIIGACSVVGLIIVALRMGPSLRGLFKSPLAGLASDAFSESIVKVMDKVTRDLNTSGWVLTSQGLNKAGFTREGKNLLVEVEDGELVFSGTGKDEAKKDLDTRG